MTSVVISQPMLFPWPGLFEQLALADVYIYLDDAQFSKGSHTNRIQVKWRDTMKWMTIPPGRQGLFPDDFGPRICWRALEASPPGLAHSIA